MTTFYSLKVARVEPETRDAVTITLRSRKPLQAEYCFARASPPPVWAKNRAAVTPFVTAARREISVAVKPSTADASRATPSTISVTITFAIPQALQAEYCFRPGQHLTLKPVWAAKNCAAVTPFVTAARRAKLASRSKPSTADASRYAQHDIQQGMELEVMVPQGHFGYQPQAERQGEYLAIAAGSGITPMMAIISATLRPSRKAALR